MQKMKTINYIKAITAIIVFMLVLNSCKKIDDTRSSINTTGLSDLEKAKAYVQQKSKEFGGLPQVFPVQQNMEVYWADKNGVPRDPKATVNSAGCTNYDLPDYTTLIQYQRIYRCTGPGYLIHFEYNVSWNKPIVATNAQSISTEGYIVIYDDNGDVFETSYSVTGADVIITDLGIDGNNSANHIYNVKFNKSTVIPTAYINGNAITTFTVRLGATFATSCPDSYGLWIVPASYFGFTGNTGLNPCDRNDRPIFLPPSIFAGQDRIGMSGYDPLYVCSEYGGSFIRTDLQQVEYSINGGLDWNPFPNELDGIPSGNPILPDGYIRYFDFAESDTTILTAGTYDIIIRFRNWKYDTYPSTLTIPTDPPDCHSAGNPSLPSGQQNYATWAYEYWPGIVIQ